MYFGKIGKMVQFDEIKQAVFDGNFAKARAYLDLTDFVSLDQLLTNLAEEDDDRATDTAYLFLEYLLLENETAELHNIASKLLGWIYCWRAGAYELGCQHLRRAIALAPDNLDYKEAILFFNEVPGSVLPKEEALRYAREVLKSRPGEQISLKILKKYGQSK